MCKKCVHSSKETGQEITSDLVESWGLVLSPDAVSLAVVYKVCTTNFTTLGHERNLSDFDFQRQVTCASRRMMTSSETRLRTDPTQ
eukprot:4096459-Amphidinium_carterae.1